MLSAIVKEHQVKTQLIRDDQDRKRKDALAAANTLTQALVDHLNIGVAQAYINEKKLDAEMRRLSTNATQFVKQTQQWLGLIENFNTSLKELGHIQSWAKSIDADCKIITSCLENVYKDTQESLSSSTSSSGAK